jgi:hypothetical protein
VVGGLRGARCREDRPNTRADKGKTGASGQNNRGKTGESKRSARAAGVQRNTSPASGGGGRGKGGLWWVKAMMMVTEEGALKVGGGALNLESWDPARRASRASPELATAQPGCSPSPRLIGRVSHPPRTTGYVMRFLILEAEWNAAWRRWPHRGADALGSTAALAVDKATFARFRDGALSLLCAGLPARLPARPPAVVGGRAAGMQPAPRQRQSKPTL